MGYSLAAIIAYVGEGSAAAAAGSAAAEGGAAAAAAGGAAASTGAAVAGTGLSTAAASGAALSATGTGVGLTAGAGATLGTAGAAAGGGGALGGIGLGTVASAASLASTAYALTKGVPKVPTPGTVTPTNNAQAISDASDAENLSRQKALAGGLTSTMLTGGQGLASPGTTTSKALLGS